MTMTKCCGWALSATLLVGGFASPANGDAYWRFEEASGGAVIDFGPTGLDGVLNGLPFRTSDVPIDPVPLAGLANARSLDLNWQSPLTGGFFQVPDTGGLLSFGAGQSFTIEAWIRLEHLSDTSSSNERQYLCQKKVLSTSNDTLDYAVLAQRGDSAPGFTYGKQSGYSGRELQVLFGTGNSVWNVTSFLEINDLDWHHVSVAYDAESNEVRFGIDGVFDVVPVGNDERTTNSGPLRVGGHDNASGVNNFFLRGSIDEVRVSRRFVPTDQLLDAFASDCNGNDTADYLDILLGRSGDCNGNGIPDECDIASGTSADCQGDGVPDECQLSPFFYAVDDRNGDISVRSDGTHMAWLNQFTVADGFETITDIDLTFGVLGAVGQPVTLYLWSDPNGDGEPSDATVLMEWSMVVEPGMNDQNLLTRVDIPDTFVGPVGTSFFVGVIVNAALTNSDFPASGDTNEPISPGRSWIVGALAPIDPNDLSAGAVEYDLFENVLPPGNWIVQAVVTAGADCNGNGIPDDCDIASGTSEDLDGNGVPDECDAPIVYVPDDFGTIQAAIDDVVAGSTIIVRPGTYLENLNFLGKGIELRSELGADVTIIDGNFVASVVTFDTGEGPASILDGFTLTKGWAANFGGGGIFCDESSPTIRNCVITGNLAWSFGGGLLALGWSWPIVTDCRFEGNTAGQSGGAVYAELQNTSVRIEDCQIVGNTAQSGVGGGVVCVNGTLVMKRNEVIDNIASDSGGGIYVISSGQFPHRIEANHIQSNHSDQNGGGLWFDMAGDIVVVNNVFAENSAQNGAGIHARGTGTIVNCTIVGNSAIQIVGGLLYDGSGGDLIVANSIFHNNIASFAPDIFYQDGVDSVTYSNIPGGWPGAGNIDSDPLFADAANGDYSLAADSPCIDAGDSTLPVLAAIALDLAGEQRIIDDPSVVDTGIPNDANAVIDMGPLERQPRSCPEDFNGSGNVDLVDLLQLLSAWGTCLGCVEDVDGTGNVDLGDLLQLLSAWGACPEAR